MTQKVELTKVQATAMDSILEEIANTEDNLVFKDKVSVIEYKLARHRFHGVRGGANSIPNDIFIQALYNGFTVEKTKEELENEAISAKLTMAENLELEDNTPYTNLDYVYSRGFAKGMQYVLETKGIELN